MIIIKHRVNSINELYGLSPKWGIEVDVRYHENELILHHDPFNHHVNNFERFENLLKVWKNTGPMILNIKSEGLENSCIELMQKYGVKNWFFLDMSMPYFVKYSNYNRKNEIPYFSSENLAVRFSDKEPIEYALSFSSKVRWVWVDCFESFPLNQTSHKKLINAKFKICLVSPELQTKAVVKIDEIRDKCKDLEIHAVCTKFPEFWI